jgi:hypothetical protein
VRIARPAWSPFLLLPQELARPAQKLSAVPATFTLPVLEDANSVQIALMQVIEVLLSGRIDSKTAGLLLYPLQTASLNLKQTDLEPVTRARVVIDPGSVRETPLDEYPWDEQDFVEDDEEEGDDADDEGDEENNEEETGDHEEGEENEEDEDDEDDGEQQYRDGQDLAALLLQKLGLLAPHTENEGHIESRNDAHDETSCYQRRLADSSHNRKASIQSAFLLTPLNRTERD